MKKIITICIVVLFVLSFAVFSVFYQLPSEKLNYDYEIEISPPSNESYLVLVPIPMDRDNNVSEIVKNLEIISGTCTYTINHTEKGPALEIAGKGYVHLCASGDHLEYKCPRLSMYIENGWITGYWVRHNLEGKNISIVVDLHILSTYAGPVVPIGTSSTSINEHGEGAVKEEWEIIKGYSKGVVAD